MRTELKNEERFKNLIFCVGQAAVDEGFAGGKCSYGAPGGNSKTRNLQF